MSEISKSEVKLKLLQIMYVMKKMVMIHPNLVLKWKLHTMHFLLHLCVSVYCPLLDTSQFFSQAYKEYLFWSQCFYIPSINNRPLHFFLFFCMFLTLTHAVPFLHISSCTICIVAVNEHCWIVVIHDVDRVWLFFLFQMYFYFIK